MICVLLSSVGVAAADTVMVYVEIRPDPAQSTLTKEVTDQAPELRNALEQGVMDALFEAGQIVFNELPSAVSAPQARTADARNMQKLYSIQRTAARGGATRLIDIALTYRPDKTGKKVEPVAASYSLWNLSPSGEVVSGIVDAGPVKAASKTSGGEVCVVMGQKIATTVLNKW